MALLYTPANPRSTRIHQRPVVGCRTRVSLQRSIAAVFATDFGNLNWRHLESGRRRLTRTMRRARVWIRARLTQPLTAKGKQSRMGKGKGKLSGWTGYVRPGTLLYELSPTARAARVEHPSRHTRATGEFPYGDVARKLPFGVKVVRRAVSEARQHRRFLTFRARRRRAFFNPKRAMTFRSRKTLTKIEDPIDGANGLGALRDSAGAIPVTVVYFLWKALQHWETRCGVAVPTPLRSFGAPLLASAVASSFGDGSTAGSAKPEKPIDQESASSTVTDAPCSQGLGQKYTNVSSVAVTSAVTSAEAFGVEVTSEPFSGIQDAPRPARQTLARNKKPLSVQQSSRGQNLHQLKWRLARKSRGAFSKLARRLLSPLALRRSFLRQRTPSTLRREALSRERAALVRLLRRDGAAVRRSKRLRLRRTKQLAGLWAARTQFSEQPQPAFGKQLCLPVHAIPASERALRSLREVGPGLRLLCLEEARAARRFRSTQRKVELFRQRARRRSRGRRRSLRQERWGSWRALRLRRTSITGFRNRKQLPPRPPLAR